jgi:hypothetical protein
MPSDKYVLLGKTSSNQWVPISLLYPNLLDFSDSYQTLEEAQVAKGHLKQIIGNRPELGKKVPYHIQSPDLGD